MSVTSFAKAIDNIATTVSVAFTASTDTKLYVASTTGISLSGSEWVRVSTARSGSPLSILKATGIGSDANGPYLTLPGAGSAAAVDGYTNVNLNVGDAAELRVTAGAFNNLSTAVNNLESGANLQNKPTAIVATTAALAANTYANGTSGVGATLTANANGAMASVDGHTPVAGDLILVKNESTGANNGLYTVTQVGDASHPYILTRSVSMDSSAKYVGASILVGPSGTTNGKTIWECTNTSDPTVGTTGITFGQVGGGSSLAIGSAVGSGTANRLLYCDSSVNLADSSLTYVELQDLRDYVYGKTTSYPIYHQNWDGAAGTYADWLLGGTTGFSVGAGTILSSPNVLNITNTTGHWVLTNNWMTKSGDGLATWYYKLAGSNAWPILGFRVQGQAVKDVDYPHYTVLFNDNGSSSSLYGPTGVGVDPLTFTNGNVIALEVQMIGLTFKTSIYDRTQAKWLKSDGTWQSSRQVALTNTDSTKLIRNNGYFWYLAPGTAVSFDDFYWDAPSPVLNRSSANITQWSTTIQLTAGGFSDPFGGVTWASDNTGVATVSAGLVTRVANGTATITATGVADTSQTATCTITSTSS